jgi:hypothetical protein
MSYERLNVHSKIVGKGKKYLKTINHFFNKKKNIVKKMFLLQNSFWNLVVIKKNQKFISFHSMFWHVEILFFIYLFLSKS